MFSDHEMMQSQLIRSCLVDKCTEIINITLMRKDNAYIIINVFIMSNFALFTSHKGDIKFFFHYNNIS